METIIREMKETDIDRILEIEKTAFSTPWSREAFLIELNENRLAHYIVAERDNKVLGYGGIWLIIDEGHITNIAVDAEYRGQGIGNRIVEGLIYLSIIKGLRAITLEVRVSNKIAQNLYTKYGFEAQGIRPKYYADDNEDALIMWKNIKEEEVN